MTEKATHTEIPPCTFLDDCVFATKAGESGIVLQLKPQDSECMEPVDVAAIARRFDAAMRQVTPGMRVYQYLLKRKLAAVEGGDRARAEYLAGKGLFSFEAYLVILRDGLHVEELRNTAESIRVQLGDSVPAVIVDKAGIFRFLRLLLNYDPAIAGNVGLRHNEYVDYYASDSPVEAHRGYLMVGDHFVKILTLKDPPSATKADILQTVREIPCECIVVSEWKPLDSQLARALIKKKTSHFHNAKYALNWAGALMAKFSKSSPAERPEDMQKDESASAMEAQLGKLLTDIEVNGTLLGEFALTVIVFSLDKAVTIASASQAIKAMSASDAVLYEERRNVLAAWFAALPGGHKHQLRSMYLTSNNYADMSMLFAPATGETWNAHLGAECLSVLETRQRTPHYVNLHYGDVGHTWISGMTGSGKSFACNYLLQDAVKKYNPLVVIFDIGGSYKAMTARVGGSYMEIGLKHDFTINPFSLPDTEENRQFLFSFVKVLIESGEKRMGDVEQDALFRTIQGNSRLSDLMGKLPESLRPHLSRWVGSGQYGSLFDNEADTLTCARFQAFDFEGLEKYPQILEPLLFYVLHRANAGIYDNAARGQFKIFLLDEAWKFLLNPTVKAYIYESLKTWRKRNAAMWLATQSIGDLSRDQAEMMETVAENCGSIVLMPNPRMDREHYRKVFKLNDRELDEVAGMHPKRESLWKPAVGPSKVLILDAGR